MFRSALEVVSLRSLVVLRRGKEQVLGESTSGKKRNNVRFGVNQQTTLGRNLPQSEIGDKKDKRAYSVCIISSRGKFRFERADGSTFETPIPPFALKSREEETPDSTGTTGARIATDLNRVKPINLTTKEPEKKLNLMKGVTR